MAIENNEVEDNQDHLELRYCDIEDGDAYLLNHYLGDQLIYSMTLTRKLALQLAWDIIEDLEHFDEVITQELR
jgi:hypothetical protein